ncbi:oxidoreductase [Granulicella sp. L46]|jgi:NAD(P)-dependent dehydrogenase (short-subunit alcohol dehydrogenase family)|uniref:oxidoreductase n=1 Tax=Granulicella sp. L46 TaxID=1641865 RepID=UPI00131E70E6|nr:oxidoreductase [Granulicella sp. L46]
MATGKWTAEQIPSQAGKTALITGANSGIGYQAALELARHGAHVLLGCRNEAKGRAALERLLREAPGASAEVVPLDMASLASIRAFAASFIGRGIALDLLINNAGVMALPKRELTEDGFERQFGTNHLGHFALTGLLLPALLAAPAPRVVTVASLAHRTGKIDFDNLQRERGYEGWDAYNASKLANILFAKELDRRARAAHSRLLSLAVHPGVSTTSIFENGPGTTNLKAIMVKLLAPVMMQNDEAGALPTLYAATSPDAKGGEYIGPDGFGELKGAPVVVQPRPQALDVAVGERLWTVSEDLTGVHYPALS